MTDEQQVEELAAPSLVEVSINPGDLTLNEASKHADDGANFWLLTMWAILDRFPQITLDDYWGKLTVAEHRLAVEYLKASDGG